MDAATTEQYKAADTSAGASKEEQPAVEGGASPQAVEEGEAKSSRSNGRASKSPRASKSKKKSQYAVGKESTPTVLGPELVKLTNPNSPPAIPTAPAEASPGALEAPDSEPNPESEAQEGGVKTPEAQVNSGNLISLGTDELQPYLRFMQLVKSSFAGTQHEQHSLLAGAGRLGGCVHQRHRRPDRKNGSCARG